MNTVTHHSRETAYELSDRGTSGVPLLFVHGGGGTRAVWKGQFRLASERPIAALDLSGHGASDDVDADPGFETLSAYADDVVAVTEATDARVLVGTSLGGAVVLHVAMERSLDLDALVLAGTGARLPVLADLLEWLEHDFERALEFLHAPGRLFADPDERLVERSLALMRDTGQAVTLRDFRTSHRFDVRDRLDEIDIPTLAVVGESDQLTPPWYHDELATEIPNAGLSVIDNAGHLAMIERPEAFNDVLRGFLNET